jgi:DNA-binding IclR family transcriptional regulator
VKARKTRKQRIKDALNGRVNWMDNKYVVPSVEKALRILYLLKEPDYRQSRLTDIAEALGIYKSTCFAILKTLQTGNLVIYDEESGLYRLGLGWLGLASSVFGQQTFLKVARAVMNDLAANIRKTCFLAMRSQEERFTIVEKAEGFTEIHVSFSLGRSLPIWAGASGKCFMAFMDPDEVEAILDKQQLTALTSNTITEIELYRQELAEIRKRGYATNYEETSIGTNVVAAPIFDERPIRLDEIGVTVRGAALRATQIAGGKVPSILQDYIPSTAWEETTP